MSLPWPKWTADEWRQRVAAVETKGGAGSGNFGHAGRPGLIGGSSSSGETVDSFEALESRPMSSEEGYTWHETGPVAAWARGLTKDERNLVGGYVGFGYKDINNTLRGDPPMKKELVRPATEEEIAAHRDALYRGDRPEIPVGDGVLVFSMFDKPAFRVERQVVDTERRDRAIETAAKIDAFIEERGHVLQEPITVSRYAYFPGIAPETFTQDVSGTSHVVRTEQGFSSTMLGEAGGRLKYGQAAAKADSVYARYGSKLDNYNNDVGTAVLFEITIPAGTKVLSVEGIRRTDDRSAARGVPDSLARREPDYRGESEVLLGSGAKFVVVSAGPGGTSDFSGLKAPVTRVRMQYVGGGSSQDPYADNKDKQ